MHSNPSEVSGVRGRSGGVQIRGDSDPSRLAGGALLGRRGTLAELADFGELATGILLAYASITPRLRGGVHLAEHVHQVGDQIDPAIRATVDMVSERAARLDQGGV